MSYCEIISTLYESQDLSDCIKKLVWERHCDDFRQELFIILLEIPKEKIIELHNKSGLKYFVVRICLNLVRQKRNVYHKKYLLHEHKVLVSTSDRTACGLYHDDYWIDNKTNADEFTIREYDAEADNFTKRVEAEESETRLVNHIETDLESVFGTHYYKSLVKLIAEKGSMREVSRQTGIPISSISESVKKVRLHLQSL